MSKAIICVGLSAVGCSALALAHPTDTAYDTRGECEAAYAEASKYDRERLVKAGVFDTHGEAQRTFRDIFRCEYDEDQDVWYIVLVAAP